MKTVFNIVLVLCAAALVYICYASIMVLSILKTQKKTEKKQSLLV